MAKKKMKLIRFDWAMKRLLRDKANFVVLEGFLSVLLNEDIKIQTILGGQSNKKDEDDKYNDVDILVKNTKNEYVIIEVQNTKQHDYFHRILYGASKVITEYIDEGQTYSNVKKVISITIAYFDLGQGEDYVYHGTTNFKGFYKGDILSLSVKQKILCDKYKVYEIYPEFWIIKAGLFDEEKVNSELDEWIFFLKTGAVLEDFTAPGLEEAKEKLDKMKLSRKERLEYEAYVERQRKIASYQMTEVEEVKDLVEKTAKETEKRTKVRAVLGMKKIGMPDDKIAEALDMDIEQVKRIITEHNSQN